ncbi:hypothetical protein ACHAW6_015489 [Cyclotella cf. meneghiniana]
MANTSSMFVPSIAATHGFSFVAQSLHRYRIQRHPRYHHHHHHKDRCKPCIPFPPMETKRPLGTNSFGLTDDGDFAIIGVNMVDPDEEDSDKTNNDGQTLGGDISARLTGTLYDGKTLNKKSFSSGTPIDWQNVGSYSGASSVGSSYQGSVGPNHMRHENRNFALDDEDLREIKEWLLEIIPTLSRGDVDKYSIGLSNIGFNPKCVTMCELTYEDLDFMKVLHRRYFFNEVTGVEHPWEV